VWIPLCERLLGVAPAEQPFLVLGDKYARAVKVAASAQPTLFALAEASDIPALLPLIDGVMLTGSPSNVHPRHFGETVADTSLPLDEARDALTLALVQACIKEGVPLLGVCRGFQEINVALGGSLHQAVQNVPGMNDHREPKGAPLAEQYAPAHEVTFVKGSVFEQWAGASKAKVNSLHGQGIAKLAPSLAAEAHATDGLIEAFSVRNAKNFAYAVQWHPEWHAWLKGENPFYENIFKAFGAACKMRQQVRFSTVETQQTIAA
jgi:putative glutamine amidotransferase